MFSGSKNNGVILLFLPHLPVMFTVRNSKGILSCTWTIINLLQTF